MFTLCSFKEIYWYCRVEGWEVVVWVVCTLDSFYSTNAFGSFGMIPTEQKKSDKIDYQRVLYVFNIMKIKSSCPKFCAHFSLFGNCEHTHCALSLANKSIIKEKEFDLRGCWNRNLNLVRLFPKCEIRGLILPFHIQ